MPTVVTNCLNLSYVALSPAAIAMITRPQGRTRRLKISNIRQVRFF